MSNKELIEAINNSKLIVADKTAWNDLVSTEPPDLPGDPTSQERYNAAMSTICIVEDNDVEAAPRMPIQVYMGNGVSKIVYQDPLDFGIYDEANGGKEYDVEVLEKLIDKDAAFNGADIAKDSREFAKFVCGDHVDDGNVILRSTLDRQLEEDENM